MCIRDRTKLDAQHIGIIIQRPQLVCGITPALIAEVEMCIRDSYYCVRAAGARAIDASVLAIYHFLRDEAHVKFFLFLLFFIPGTPKDLSLIHI